jgi:DNA-binding MarR family transcriptional regulator
VKRQNEKVSSLDEDYEDKALKKATENLPDLNPNLVRLGVSFVLMSNAVYDVIENYFKNELKFSQAKFIILMHLSAEAELNQTEIAQRWRVSDSAISKVIKGLEKSGLINRRKSVIDRRDQIISITPKGKQFFNLAVAEYSEWLHKNIGKLNDKELENLTLTALWIKNLFCS